MRIPDSPNKFFALSIALTAAAYLLGLPGGFIFDDWPNLLSNKAVQITSLDLNSLSQAWHSGITGALDRPVSMLTFAVNHYFSGLEPSAFKITNLAIHLLNGLLVYLLLRSLLNAWQHNTREHLPNNFLEWVAAVTAAAWLLHPINITSVLYVVQRMTSLSAFFVLLGLWLYCIGRNRQIQGLPGRNPIFISIGICLPLAVLSKENGILLLPFIFLLELGIYRWQTNNSHIQSALFLFFGICLVLPAVALLAYTIASPEWLIAGYAGRDFTLTERLLTQPRVLWLYLRLILTPSPADMGLFHDDFPISTSITAPATTLAALAGILVLTAIAISLIVKRTLFALGVAFFLVGHSLESTIIPLEMVYEHRNYLPGIGILLIFFYYLLYPTRYLRTLRLRVIGGGLFLIFLAILLTLNTRIWSNPVYLNMEAARRHPESVRANITLGRDFSIAAASTTDPEKRARHIAEGIKYCSKATKLDSNGIEGPFCLLVLENLSSEIKQETFHTLLYRLRTATPTHAVSGWMTMLVTNRESVAFAIQREKVVDIFNAALENPRLVGGSKAIVVTKASDYALNALKDYETARFFSAQAIELQPENAQYYLNAAKIERYLDSPEAAIKYLQKAKQLDKNESLQAEIEAELEYLSKNSTIRSDKKHQ